MHDLRLIHTDLKPENILLVSSEYIKIPDYKVSNQIIFKLDTFRFMACVICINEGNSSYFSFVVMKI